MKKYLQPDEKITFCRVDKKGSVARDGQNNTQGLQGLYDILY